jgi:phage terminase Nu1 subunit (DNA packaging protein)
VRSQTVQDQILPALARLRPVLSEVRVQTERTATEHEQMAAWYAKHGNHAAAGMERRAAAVQRQRLADLDAAFQALEEAVSAALNLDSYLAP